MWRGISLIALVSPSTSSPCKQREWQLLQQRSHLYPYARRLLAICLLIAGRQEEQSFPRVLFSDAVAGAKSTISISVFNIIRKSSMWLTLA